MVLKFQILFPILVALITASSQILFKKAAGILPPFGYSWHFVLSMFTNIWLIIAGFLNIAAILLWIFVLQKVNLSLAYPFIALSFIFVPTFSYIFYKEPVNIVQMLGYGLIVSGIIVISSFKANI